MTILDDIRRQHPTVGLYLYAPDGAAGEVVVELHPPVGEHITFRGPSFDVCLRSAFPLLFLEPAAVEEQPVVNVEELFE